MKIEISEKNEFSKMLMENQNIKLNIPISGITTDSRLVNSGDMYIPIKGNKVDGHDYIADILDKDPSLIVSQNSFKTDRCPVLTVNNITNLISTIAIQWRKKLNCKLIGITGSNGKTTTKELIWHILNSKIKSFKTEGNYNTVLSAPLSLLSISRKHKAAIIEIGTNQPGEIKYISNIVKPDIGLITNVSNAHIKYFNSIKAIKNEKIELIKNLPIAGTAIINTDSISTNSISINAKILTCGFEGKPDFKASIIDQENISINGHRIKLPYSGFACAQNVLIAFSTAKLFGLKNNEISERVLSFKALSGRGKVSTINNFTIIDDTYNANPNSIKMGLQRLSNWHAKNKIAILGDMYELGSKKEKLHREIGLFISKLDIQSALLIGESMKFAFFELKSTKINSHWFSTKKDLLNFITHSFKEKTVLYFKGSRGMQMEKIIEELK